MQEGKKERGNWVENHTSEGRNFSVGGRQYRNRLKVRDDHDDGVYNDSKWFDKTMSACDADTWTDLSRKG